MSSEGPSLPPTPVLDAPGAPAGLVGRDAVMLDLLSQAELAFGGQGRLLLVTGDPGMGKTALAAELARQARGWGAAVVWGSSQEGDLVPLQPWSQVLAELQERAGRASSESLGPAVLLELSRFVPGLPVTAPRAATTEGRPEQARFRLFEAVAAALQVAAQQGPVVVVIDDLQWSDDTSLMLLSYVADRVKAHPLLLLGTVRDDAEWAGRSTVTAELERRAVCLPLTGLGVQDVRALMTAVAGRDVGHEAAAAVRSRTGGNPFFVHQLTRLLLSRSDGRIESGALPHLGLPSGVRQTIERRLARLSEGCVRTLRAAAVAGPQVRTSLLVAVTGASRDEIEAAMEEALRARVMLPLPAREHIHAFGHDLFREVVYTGTPGPDRAGLHARVADALEIAASAGAEIDEAEIVRHLALAGPQARRATLEHSLAAARQAAERRAYVEQARHLQRVLDLIEDDVTLAGPPGGELLLDLAEAHRRAGRTDAARESYLRAARLARRSDKPSALALAALGLQEIGADRWLDAGEILDLLHEAQRALPDQDQRLRALLLAARSRELAWRGRAQEGNAETAANEAVRLARRYGDDGVLAACLLALHNVIWRPGTAARRLPLADEVLSLGQRCRDDELEYQARQLRCMALLELGDDSATASLLDLVADSRRSPLPAVRWSGLCCEAALMLFVGDYDRAERTIDEAAELGRDLAVPDAWNVWAAQMVELRSAQGRLGELMASWQQADSAAMQHPVWAGSLAAAAALERGDRDRAKAALSPVVDKPLEAPAPAWAQLLEVLYPAEPAADIPLLAACERFYRSLSGYAGVILVEAAIVRIRGSADFYLGLLARAAGRSSDATGHLEAALADHERLSAWPLAARTRFELALALLDTGRPDDLSRARVLLDEAHAAATGLGMTALLRRISDHRAGGSPATGEFTRHGKVWTLVFAGTSAQLPDSKGLRDIATLLARPARPVPAVDLVVALTAEVVREHLGLGRDPVLDERARREFRARVGALDEEIAEAERDHDEARATRARAERDAVLAQLSVATGAGGRWRGLGDPRERARKAVAARIQDALRRVEAVHPPLAAHLHASVRTGSTCEYRPDRPVVWQL